jgi:hypothetical protein
MAAMHSFDFGDLDLRRLAAFEPGELFRLKGGQNRPQTIRAFRMAGAGIV